MSRGALCSPVDNEEDSGLFQYLIRKRVNSVCYIVDKKVLLCQCCITIMYCICLYTLQMLSFVYRIQRD